MFFCQGSRSQPAQVPRDPAIEFGVGDLGDGEVDGDPVVLGWKSPGWLMILEVFFGGYMFFFFFCFGDYNTNMLIYVDTC